MLSGLLEKTVVPDLSALDEVVVVSKDESVVAAAKRVADTGTPGLIVIDGTGAVTGHVPVADLLRALAMPQSVASEEARVGDLARRMNDFVAPDDPVLDAIQLMRLRGASYLPVVDNGRPVALVTLADISEALALAMEDGFYATENAVFSSTPEE
jgi:CBS domain-containing protein